MGSGVESRFERYAEKMIETLGHADRATPARWYLRGLMLPGQRKSVEPMAERVYPQKTAARRKAGSPGTSCPARTRSIGLHHQFEENR